MRQRKKTKRERETTTTTTTHKNERLKVKERERNKDGMKRRKERKDRVMHGDKYERREMDASPETITSPSAHSCCHGYRVTLA